MPLVIGITGSIATGKTGLCWHLVEHYNALHGDADKLVHRMFDPGTRGYYDVIKEFGKEVLTPDAYIDRKKIGDMVFGNPENMSRWMRAISNPRTIEQQIKRQVDEWRATLGPNDIAILEAVNLIEAGYSAWCEQTWLVAAENETAKKRLMARNNFTEQEAQQRLDSQRKWQDRAPAADYVFHNDGDFNDLLDEADRELERVIDEHRAGTLAPSKWHAWREANPRQQPPRREEAREGAEAQRS